jgi:two-component system, response regulator RegA
MTDCILVVDDDPTFNAVLVQALRRRQLEAEGCSEPHAVIDTARRLQPARIVLDLSLGGVSGLSLIQPLVSLLPGVRIVVLTGYASITTAVDAIKLGAHQYLAKPIDVDAIITAFGGAPEIEPDAPIDAVPLSVGRLEWEHIQRVLHEHNENISATARALKMHRRTLQRKLMKRPPRA